MAYLDVPAKAAYNKVDCINKILNWMQRNKGVSIIQPNVYILCSKEAMLEFFHLLRSDVDGTSCGIGLQAMTIKNEWTALKHFLESL